VRWGAGVAGRRRESGDLYSRGGGYGAPLSRGRNNELRSQSSLAPLALMGPAQRAISLTTNLARYSGVLRSAAGMVTPMLLNPSRPAGGSTASLTALARRRTISSGVPLGNESEPQLPQSRPARPSSCAVASCSRPGARSSPSVAIALTVPP